MQHGLGWSEVQELTEAQLQLFADTFTYNDIVQHISFYKQRLPLVDMKASERRKALHSIDKQLEAWRRWFSGVTTSEDDDFVAAIKRMRKQSG